MGQEVIDSTATTHSCPVKITRTNEAVAETALTNNVEYDVSSTPYITGISPRWGSVEGGTEVTFSG